MGTDTAGGQTWHPSGSSVAPPLFAIDDRGGISVGGKPVFDGEGNPLFPTGGGGGPSPATSVTGPDAFGATPVVGASLSYARQDHDHGLPANPNPPLGTIAMWSMKNGAVPTGWAVCDGASNSPGPDLRGYFIQGATTGNVDSKVGSGNTGSASTGVTAAASGASVAAASTGVTVANAGAMSGSSATGVTVANTGLTSGSSATGITVTKPDQTSGAGSSHSHTVTTPSGGPSTNTTGAASAGAQNVGTTASTLTLGTHTHTMGSHTHTLTSPTGTEAAHTHDVASVAATVTDGGHTHSVGAETATVTDGGHTHTVPAETATVTDPQHAHGFTEPSIGVTDPGHVHTVLPTAYLLLFIQRMV